ncbi:N-acetyltransferase [Kocuria rhizophila]|nr:N-acetyltransferase [Kocuria rhizophila]
MAVDPARQGEGIGSRLMTALVQRAAEAGQPVLVLLGDPEFYSRFGFVPASRIGITGEPEWGEFFQAAPLGDGVVDPGEYLGPRGCYEYAEPFARLG